MNEQNKTNEKTLLIVKPDGIKRQLENRILEMTSKNTGLKIKCLKRIKLSSEVVEKFYSHVKSKVNENLFAKIIEYMCSSEVIAAVLEGEDAVLKVRQICGPTDPLVAKIASPGSIRALFSNDSLELALKENRAVQNVVHSSGTREEAEREISLLNL